MKTDILDYFTPRGVVCRSHTSLYIHTRVEISAVARSPVSPECYVKNLHNPLLFGFASVTCKKTSTFPFPGSRLRCTFGSIDYKSRRRRRRRDRLAASGLRQSRGTAQPADQRHPVVQLEAEMGSMVRLQGYAITLSCDRTAHTAPSHSQGAVRHCEIRRHTWHR